jgi:elongation factor Tu
VVTGRVERGKIQTMDEVEVIGLKETRKAICTKIEMFRKMRELLGIILAVS